MNSDYEKQLAAAVDRALKALPDLKAPGTLAPRVMAAIARRALVPWYRQAWPNWPKPLQALLLVLLGSLFGGLTYLGWALPRTEAVAGTLQQGGRWLAELGVVWNTANALVGALGTVIKHLNPAFLLGCLVALGLGYMACVSLGAIYMRVAFSKGWDEAER